ncbi:hypothetical protein Tcan_17643 [Toxocara canis]|uniref:SCP domain-containing protein n=1 Tax=Toxocara canis TaxID=6265 RepID=A0A0B2V5F6_TOXCA|nr:hypothetical protein Tcan_17643 [Toxocara canis]
MLLLLPALLLVTSTFATGSQCPGVTNAKFDDATREKIIAKHNEYRSKIAHGTAKYKGGQTLSSGKNSWDCSLEQSAQNWSDRCEFDPSYPDDFGENYDEFNATNPSTFSLCHTLREQAMLRTLGGSDDNEQLQRPSGHLLSLRVPLQQRLVWAVSD